MDSQGAENGGAERLEMSQLVLELDRIHGECGDHEETGRRV